MRINLTKYIPWNLENIHENLHKQQCAMFVVRKFTIIKFIYKLKGLKIKTQILKNDKEGGTVWADMKTHSKWQ